MHDLPATMTPFHWHGDIFDLPPGAVSLASSAKTPCQAFRLGDKTYGFQFHIEVTADGVAAMADAFAKELVREKIPADRMIAQAAEFLPTLEKISDTVFSRWASPIQGMS
jgi:GMP synthase (glutamine-hydrolysing)